MSRTRRIRGGALLAAAAIVLGGACSVSSTGSSDTTKPGSSATTVAGPDYAKKFANAPVRGVTDTSIKIGAALIDYAGVKKQFGVDLSNGGDPLPKQVVPALLKSVNDSGGVNGRKLEIVSANFIPVGTDSSEQSCRKLIQDEKVFAVVGMYLDSNMLCVTRTNQTTYFSGWGLTSEQQAQARAPYIIAGSSAEQLADDQVSKGVAAGVFKGSKVAVYWENEEPDSLIEDHVIAPLKKAGVDVVSQAKLPDSNDQVKAGQDIDRILQRFKADGADQVLFYSGMGVVIPALERSSWHPKVVFVNGQAVGDLSGFGLKNPDVLKGAVSLMDSTPSSIMEKDPEFLECLDTINANSDLDLKPTDIESPKDRPGSVGASGVPAVCQWFQLMVKVLTAAGAHPSASSIVTGLGKLGDFSLPAIPNASLAPDKWGTGSEVHIWHFDVAKGQFIRDDEPGFK